MKFTGQVRVPEIDHPGVPATILIDGDQAEVFLEGESLGRWSLFDVQAVRLVSSAFSLSLHGEEITFIADEPVDFAYKGVDHMADAWARFKSMSVPRRVVAVGRSRRGTHPSRIGELREAMLKNLEAAGRGPTRLDPIDTAPVMPVHDAPAAAGAEPVKRAPIPHPYRRSQTEAASSPVEEAETFAPSSPSKLRPGAGLMAAGAARSEVPTAELEQVLDTPAIADPEPVFAPPEIADPEPVSPPPEFADPEPLSPPAETAIPSLRSPWDEPPAGDEPGASDQVPDQTLRPVPEPVAGLPPTGVGEGTEPPRVGAPPAADATDEEEPATEAVPELVEELLSTSSDEGGEEGARDLVVDLGRFEGRRRSDAAPSSDPPAPSAPREPALAVASPDASERGGLLGAVRSAFVRNKVAHEHEFTEAPGGIGIVRQICAECGYISIGLSD
ncbi:MAG TPA: hypothetical protein VMS99_06005 [Acidimicrobiia bacterium]|nr:hypothetical protein [Acidimicrobiia bacterium]